MASSFTERTMAPACASNWGLPGPAGFARTVRAPASIALNDQATSSGSTALIMTMGVGVSRMMRRVASKPSITGICTSIVTRSGARRAVSRTASAPLTASPATVMSGSRDRMDARSFREERESSTTRTRGMTVSDQPAHGLEQAVSTERALDDVGVGADLHTAGTILGGVERGHQDHREVPEPGVAL